MPDFGLLTEHVDGELVKKPVNLAVIVDVEFLADALLPHGTGLALGDLLIKNLADRPTSACACARARFIFIVSLQIITCIYLLMFMFMFMFMLMLMLMLMLMFMFMLM